jgi:hypothetical protein
MRILVVWEDRYHETLGPFVKRRLMARAPSAPSLVPQVLFHTSYGVGSFKRYVGSTWDRARASGLPLDKGRIEHMICVADGDKLHEQIQIPAAPPAAADVHAWLSTAEQAWQQHLRALCEGAPPSTVHGRILRWSKESLLLAGYDREPVRRTLGIDVQHEGVRSFLNRCIPLPSALPAAGFTDTFRKPLRCLQEMDEAQRGRRASDLSKNVPEIDDALRALAREDHVTVAERVPDIDRIVDLIWQLQQGTEPASAAAPSAPAPPKKPGRRPKR